MTDYLGRLAARTIAPQSVAARPRTASAYETASAPVITERVVRVEEPRETSPAATPRGVRTSRPHSADGDIRTPSPLREPDVHVPAHNADEDVRTPLHENVDVSVTEPAPIVTIEPFETHVHHEHETIIERLERVERLNVRRERVVERERAAEVRQQHQAPPPAPIEITINRIDVHAAIAPPAEAPRPKRPAVMTLEEYVARRDGERR